jgi:DNA polymerase IV
VKGTPALSRKSSLLRYDISTPEINDSSFQNATPPEGELAKGKPEPLCSASTPIIGTLFMKNSTGIDSMLSRKNDSMADKKRKRKDNSIKLVPENDRIFTGKTFFYIPPDDIAPIRKFRITKARNFGAIWTKEVGIFSLFALVVRYAISNLPLSPSVFASELVCPQTQNADEFIVASKHYTHCC